MSYENYDRMPAVHFGYWTELLEKWVAEGPLKPDEIVDAYDGSDKDKFISDKLGFDFNYFTTTMDKTGMSSLYPAFTPERTKENPDGSYEYFDAEGVIVLQKPGVRSIPMEIDHLLKDRESWEEHYLPRLQYTEDRFDNDALKILAEESSARTEPLGIYTGSLFGQIRNWLGVVGLSMLYYDDEDLYIEIINTVGELTLKTVKYVLESGIQFDFAHFWEDICFNNGPLVNPAVFDEIVGPHYKRITDLLTKYDIDVVSLDCDGIIDLLIPTWFNNGVNTMFPIEVGTWHADIAPWREKYGKKLRGVGGMNKHILTFDKAAVDAEIERLKPLVALGGFIPCPDHRMVPDTKWELVQYYCDSIKELK
jgi:uroporphyrinogen decarboxylase